MKAIFLKELRSYMRGVRPFRMLTIYLAVLSIPLLIYYASVREDHWTGPATVGQTFFIVANIIALAQLTLLTPSNSAGSIGGERERQTFDLLLVTPISSKAIILAKLAAPVLFLSLLSLTTMPISALAFFIGGVTGTDMIISLVIMLTAAFGYGALGIFSSVVTRTSRGAATMAIAIAIFLSVGSPLLVALVEGSRSGIRDDSISLLEGPLLPVGLTMLSISPPAAFLFTRGDSGLFNLNDSIWTMTLPIGDEPVTVLAPWIISVIVWGLLSAILLVISVRKLRGSSDEAG